MRRLLVILVILAAVLAGLLFGVELPGERAQKRKWDAEEQLFDFAVDDVDSLQFFRADERITLVRDREAGGWELTSPLQTKALATAVRSELEQFATARAAKVLSDSLSGDRWGIYGLASREAGRRDIRISLHDGRAQTLHVGNESPSGGFAYARVGQTSRLLLVEKNIHQLSWTPAKSLREVRLFEVETDSIERIQVSGPAGHWSAQRDDEGRWWKSSIQSDVMLDRRAIRRITYDLSTSHIRAYVRRVDDGGWAAWGLDHPYGQLVWWSASDQGRLDLGNEAEDGDVFARRDQGIDLIRVAPTFSADVAVAVDSLVSHNPVRLNFDTCDSVVIRWTAGPRLRLVRRDDRWLVDDSELKTVAGEAPDPEVLRLAAKNLVLILETTPSDRTWWVPEGDPLEKVLDEIPVRIRVYRGSQAVRDIRLGWKDRHREQWLAIGEDRTLHRIDRSLELAVQGLGVLTGRIEP